MTFEQQWEDICWMRSGANLLKNSAAPLTFIMGFDSLPVTAVAIVVVQHGSSSLTDDLSAGHGPLDVA